MFRGPESALKIKDGTNDYQDDRSNDCRSPVAASESVVPAKTILVGRWIFIVLRHAG
jgi:hypothetical protein